MSDKFYLGQNVSDLDYDEKVSRISRINLSVDSDHIYTSGDDTGRTLEVSCPWGSQAMADSILAKVSGIDYQPYEASDSLLDPSAEIGDGITLGGVYSLLAQSSISLDKQCAANISAPYNDEVDDEYPYKSPTQRQIERNMAKTRSLITKTSEAIMLKVESIDGKYTEVKTTLDGLTVTDQSGTTRIKGSSIETGSLYVSAANITGALTVGQLPSGVAMGDDIPTKLSELYNDSGYQTETGVVSIIDGTVTADYIYALGVEASVIRGNSVGLKDGNGNTVGAMQLSYTSTGMGIAFLTNQGGIQMQPAGNVFLSSGGGAFITLSNVVSLGGAPLVLSSKMYGNTLPSSPVQGTLYFLRKNT